MGNSFVNAAREESRRKFTENGAEAYSTTSSALLDLFATVGALRSRSEEDIIDIFRSAFNEDKLLAVRTLFYARDIRGGCGERRTFRIIVKWLAENHPETLKNNIKFFGEFGRFDDLYTLVGTPLEKDMWTYMKSVLDEDLANMKANKPVTLLGKWMKSADASSAETRKLGIMSAINLGYKVRDYKRILKELRRYLDVVECKMCENQWDKIGYSSVPSRAMLLYRKAFAKHDNVRFSDYMNAVASGTEKINATTLYPYDVVEAVLRCSDDKVAEEQWKALPDYLDGADDNILVMADVSGSMCGRPMNSAVGLALYFAERNHSCFHNLFMTFESKPQFVSINEHASLTENISKIMRASWGGSTNFYGAMKMILDLATRNNIPAEDMPKALVCISDMEFDCANRNYCYGDSDAAWDATILERAKKDFESAGYALPNIVFWNVNARNDTFHTDKLDKGVLAVSGQSASAFKIVLNSLNMTPYEAMLNTLNSERYSVITID